MNRELCIICTGRPPEPGSDYCAECQQESPEVVAEYEAHPELKLAMMKDTEEAQRAERRNRAASSEDLATHDIDVHGRHSPIPGEDFTPGTVLHHFEAVAPLDDTARALYNARVNGFDGSSGDARRCGELMALYIYTLSTTKETEHREPPPGITPNMLDRLKTPAHMTQLFNAFRTANGLKPVSQRRFEQLRAAAIEKVRYYREHRQIPPEWLTPSRPKHKRPRKPGNMQR